MKRLKCPNPKDSTSEVMAKNASTSCQGWGRLGARSPRGFRPDLGLQGELVHLQLYRHADRVLAVEGGQAEVVDGVVDRLDQARHAQVDEAVSADHLADLGLGP